MLTTSDFSVRQRALVLEEFTNPLDGTDDQRAGPFGVCVALKKVVALYF